MIYKACALKHSSWKTLHHTRIVAPSATQYATSKGVTGIGSRENNRTSVPAAASHAIVAVDSCAAYDPDREFLIHRLGDFLTDFGRSGQFCDT